MAVSDLCRVTQRPCRNINTKTLDSWAGAFLISLSLALSLKRKKKYRKTVQNHHFPLTFIEMSFE